MYRWKKNEGLRNLRNCGLALFTCGPNRVKVRLKWGESAARWLNELKDILNVPTPAKVVVNGKTTQARHPIQPGDSIEVVRWVGCKRLDEDLLRDISKQLTRIADHFDPTPPDLVDTQYVANKLGCTKVWVAKMALEKRIPKAAIVQGTGDGRPWKFYRSWIDHWIETDRKG